jgi:SAM-dependent methyltransferase
LNKFVQENHITDIIEYGCGDGNQLRLAQYQSYIGFDVSPDAVSRCKAMFSEDSTKKFLLTDEYNGETAALTLCLDVIYHLVEDAVFDGYMHRLFDSSNKYVVIYSSNTDYNPPGQPDHVKHRKFTSWVEQNKPEWALHSFIPNRYPFTGDVQTGSFSDFYIYEKA